MYFIGQLLLRIFWLMLLVTICSGPHDKPQTRKEVIPRPPGHADCTTDMDCQQKHGFDMDGNQIEVPNRYIIPTNPKGAKPYEYWRQNY